MKRANMNIYYAFILKGMKMRSGNAKKKKCEINEHMMSSWKSQLLISNLQVVNIGIIQYMQRRRKEKELF